MKINKYNLGDFLNTINNTKGNVFLRSQEGDIYNLKSTLCQYVAIAALLSQHGDELELFCEHKEDEPLFFEFFRTHKEVL